MPRDISTLSLHDALPIYGARGGRRAHRHGDDPVPPHGHGLADERARPARDGGRARRRRHAEERERDRKSTRLNSSHTVISYSVFCLKKKTITLTMNRTVH